jgi:putative peptidoglycan lipid II flippase
VVKRKEPTNKDTKSLEEQPVQEDGEQQNEESVAVVESTPLAPGIGSQEPLSITETVVEAQPGERREIVKSASLVMMGNLGSSLMGMVRQMVVAAAGKDIAAPFLAALTPAQQFYDFLINGSTSGALIPTFNDYADRRDELRRLVFTIVNLMLIMTVTSSLLFLFVAPWLFTHFLASGYDAASQELSIRYGQIVFFSLVGLAPFAVLLAALYALKEFGWPAFATASYHIGIILGAGVGSVIGGSFFGTYGIAAGVLIGVAGEIALLIPGMRNQHLRYMFVLDLKHPALARIIKLYIPIAFGYLVTSGLVFLDQILATNAPCAMWVQGVKNCGEANLPSMRFATVLIQFPQGLVGAALSFAVLPTLTGHSREGNMERFKETLLLGFRLGLLLMIPAAAGLISLQLPIVKTLFEHNKFTPDQVTLTALALQNYAYQLPFIAIDQLLIAAFYARKNTIVPVTVGVVSILGYLVVALPLVQFSGIAALALANAAQNSLHAVILLVLLRIAIGPLHVRRLLPALAKILLATAALVAVAWGTQALLAMVPFFSMTTLKGRVLTLIISGGLAAATYFGGVLLLRVEEIHTLKGVVLAKFGKR